MSFPTLVGRNLEAVRRHFEAENNHDAAGIAETYADDVLWDDVTRPLKTPGSTRAPSAAKW